jgi:hypothetical protein
MQTFLRSTHSPSHARCIEAALLLRSGFSEDEIAAEYGKAVLAQADLMRYRGLQETVEDLTGLRGEAGIKAAFSTATLPGILSSVAHKRLLKGYRSQPTAAPRLCSIGDLTDFKPSERFGLTDMGDLEPIGPDGEIKHGGLSERKAVNRLETFGKAFVITREMLVNDDLGAFLRLPEMMGARAARKVDQVFFLRLLLNPGGLFSAAHKNLLTGAASALSPDSLAAAMQLFSEQTDEDGQPLNLQPKYLLVPPSLKITAREVLHSTVYLAVGAADKRRIPTYNALADEDLEIVVSPWLSNSRMPGASEKKWFLFGDAGLVDTFELGFLRGQHEPTVERGNVSPDCLGMGFRVFFDFGVREMDHRGMVMSAGE